jgi:formamidopyrimidine-DNA glycosylase
MPELPEVESVKKDLEKMIPGKKISSVFFNYPPLLKEGGLLLNKLKGETFETISRIGKYLLFNTTQYLWVVHLGMSGVLRYQGEKQKHTHLILGFSDGTNLCFSDPRKFGYLHLGPKGEYPNRLKILGPDIMDSGFNAKHLYRKSRNRVSSIKSFLLDQSISAGIGNIYAVEALFKSAIHPAREAGALGLTDYQSLVGSVKAIMKKSIANSGTTFSDYRVSNGKSGEFQGFLKIFQKAGEPCPNCESPIQRLVQNARSSFYCPECQKL